MSDEPIEYTMSTMMRHQVKTQEQSDNFIKAHEEVFKEVENRKKGMFDKPVVTLIMEGNTKIGHLYRVKLTTRCKGAKVDWSLWFNQVGNGTFKIDRLQNLEE